MISRNTYIEKLKSHMWNNNVKVITGIRRCGKSTLLFNLFYDYLLSIGVSKDEIILIKLDEDKFFQYRNPILLSKYLKTLTFDNNKKYYVFIDEIQLSTPKTDRNSGIKLSIFDVLNGLNNNDNIDVYVTGSNSKMLSKDILTEFRGRTTQIRVHPFSFKEYVSYRNINETECLDEYLVMGGMPELMNIENEEDKKQYLIDLFNKTYLKDIVERKHIARVDILNDILNYLASQISSLTNINSIANAMTSIRNERVNHEIVFNYVDYLMDAFLISEVKRYDVKGKKYFDYPSKFYFEDIGLRNAALNFRQLDTGHLMENVIYNELIRRGYNVDVGMVSHREKEGLNKYEIDFIVNNIDQKLYIQCAYMIDNVNKELSETKSLILTRDNFKKVLIRNDIASSYYDEQGIFNCKLTDFLLDKVQL